MNSHRTRNGGYRRAYETEGYYIDGNTIRRKTEAAEFSAPQKKMPARRIVPGKAKAQSISAGYVFFMIIMMFVLVTGCLYYLNLRTELTQQQKEITELESELSLLKLKNEEEYDRIMGAVDMEQVKRIAMEDLGMTYPGAEQVVGISGTGGDYVRQYKEIPRNERKARKERK